MNVLHPTCLGANSSHQGKRKFTNPLSFGLIDDEEPKVTEKGFNDGGDSYFAPPLVRKRVKRLVEEAGCVNEKNKFKSIFQVVHEEHGPQKRIQVIQQVRAELMPWLPDQQADDKVIVKRIDRILADCCGIRGSALVRGSLLRAMTVIIGAHAESGDALSARRLSLIFLSLLRYGLENDLPTRKKADVFVVEALPNRKVWDRVIASSSMLCGKYILKSNIIAHKLAEVPKANVLHVQILQRVRESSEDNDPNLIIQAAGWLHMMRTQQVN